MADTMMRAGRRRDMAKSPKGFPLVSARAGWVRTALPDRLGLGGQPRPILGGEADEAALDEVAAPVAQQRCGLLVLHPFGYRLEVETAGKIDHGLHEGAVIGRARHVLHERAIDLDHVDAELAQIAERGEAGAEIVD